MKVKDIIKDFKEKNFSRKDILIFDLYNKFKEEIEYKQKELDKKVREFEIFMDLKDKKIMIERDFSIFGLYHTIKYKIKWKNKFKKFSEIVVG